MFLGEREFQQLSLLQGDSGILVFTQPLSEDSYISEERKILVYRTICERLSQHGKIVVKIHPRDKTDYKFQNVSVSLSASYPSELLLLFPIEFTYAIGICTSAVVGCNARKCLNLCDDYLKTLDDSFLERIDEVIQ